MIFILEERIRALLPPQLEAFRQSFRTAFHVLEELPSIAWLDVTGDSENWPTPWSTSPHLSRR